MEHEDGICSAAATGQAMDEPSAGSGQAPPLRTDPLLQARFTLPLLEQLSAWHHQAVAGDGRRPLIALNGPVGAGKSTLGRQLETLASERGLRLVVASIDDLYLPWEERQARLAGNPFGVNRVPPGSHDLPLLLEALQRWRTDGVLRLPRFDKTMAAGQGDRAGWREEVCEALVLEGWLMGCQPLAPGRLAAVIGSVAADGTSERPEGGAPSMDAADRRWSAERAPRPAPEEWAWLPHWNEELEHYRPLWRACDGLWLLRPLHWGLPRRWRFQAEARQRRRGGGWLGGSDLDAIVRATLCSLPPPLYQDPLLEGLAWAAGQTWRASGASGGTALNAWVGGPADASADEAQGDGAESLREGGTGRRVQQARLQEPSASAPGGRSGGSDQTQTRPQFSLQPALVGPMAGPGSGADAAGGSDRIPVQAVAWLDGRRRCRQVWRQPSASSSASEDGSAAMAD